MQEIDSSEQVARIARRYQRFLEARQRDARPGDIRARMLATRRKRVAIGFAQSNLLTAFAAGLSRLFPDAVGLRGDLRAWKQAEAFLCSGAIHPASEHSHPGANRIFGDMSIPDDKIVLFEMGFLASTYSWSHGLRQGFPEAQCLGYVYDDIAHYYMTDYPNRLIDRLNSDLELNDAETARAQALIARIVARRISKYNAQPTAAPELGTGHARRVLVCDQSFADASTVYGRIDERGFQDMLVAAIAENPDAEILVKTHPDTTWESAKRTGYYTHLKDYENVRILRDPVNPFVLFDLVDTVYVGVSQLGLEALFAGKKVVTFGAPFYAGWGLTDDRQTIPHRRRARSLTDLFHAFYVWYTIYHVPGCAVPSEIEEVLDYIEEHRPVTHLPAPPAVSDRPRVSVILPVHNVEPYVETAIRSVLNQTLRDLEVIPVNDASPDDSQAVLDRLAAEDPRVRPLVLSRNVGQGFARNAGLEAARGDFVWFLDADDWLASRDVLEAAVDRAEAVGADLVRTRKAYQRYTDIDGMFVGDRSHEPEAFFPDDIETTDFAGCPALLRHVNVYTLLYRRRFLEEAGIKFRQPRYEERVFLTDALLQARTISILDHAAVGYRVREGSTMRSAKTRADLDSFADQLDSVVDLYLAQGDRIAEGGDLAYHYRYTLTLMLSFVFRGWFYPALQALENPAATTALLDRIRAAFARAGFRPEQIERFPEFLDADWTTEGRYPLILSALQDGRYDLVDMAATGASATQKMLLELWRDQPHSTLSGALSQYASHDHIAMERPARAVDVSKVRLVLHIGSTKSGSTYLQHWLDINRPALLAQGIYVPEVGLFRQPGRPHKTAGHAEFSTASRRDDQALRNHIMAMIDRAGGTIHTVILSSEAFFLLDDPTPLCQYLQGFRREMIVYLRRQDDWANSQYAELVGGGAVRRTALSAGDWLQEPEVQLCLDYAGKMDRWADLIGADQITARVFEPGQFHGGDLLQDFAAAVGITAPQDLTDVPARLRNEATLPAGYLDLMRVCNAMPFLDTAQYLGFAQQVQDIAAEESNGAVPRPELLGQALRDRIMARAADGNAEVARRYLNRPDGALFLAPPGAPHAVTPRAPLPADAVVRIMEAYRRALDNRDQRLGAGLPVAVAEARPGWRASFGLRQYARLAYEYVALRRSPLFQPDWYRDTYSDVAASRMSPRLHFLLYGAAEGRSAGPEFDAGAYLAKNPDVRASGQNPLIHYIRHGRKEGRSL
jgi:capsular polysaccharide export protein